jgi:hypothetical protein
MIFNDISTWNGERKSFKNYTELNFHVCANDNDEMKNEWISHILHRDCLLKHITEGKIGRMGR